MLSFDNICLFMYVVVIALTRSGISNISLFFWVRISSFSRQTFFFLFFFLFILNQSRVRELRAVSAVLFWLVGFAFVFHSLQV